MLKFTGFKVSFVHAVVPQQEEVNRVTEAIVQRIGRGGKVISTNRGFFVTTGNDQFCRAVARKTALTSALSNFDRETRKAVWKEYWKKTAP